MNLISSELRDSLGTHTFYSALLACLTLGQERYRVYTNTGNSVGDYMVIIVWGVFVNISRARSLDHKSEMAGSVDDVP